MGRIMTEQREDEMDINKVDALDMALPLIKEFEGCKLIAYKCPAGIPTIGWGETQGVSMGDVWTQEQADSMLEKRVREFMDGVLKRCPLLWQKPACLAACTSFAYNVGLANFGGSSMARKLNEGDYDGASAEFPKWNKAGGKILAGLVRRREAEQALFRKGY